MNPWSDLPDSEPFVLPADDPAVRTFNQRAKFNHLIHLEVVPEPFLGNPDAPLVLLNQNPGYVDDDRKVHEDSTFNAAARANLLHSYHRWPLYLLNPELPTSPGRDWWNRKLGALIRVVGSHQLVASRVFVAELHGYHSRQFHRGLHVPSQSYTFTLVERAILRGAVIVVMRARDAWFEAVPSLSGARVTYLRNPRNPTISLGNCPEAFEAIVAAVRSAG